MYRVDLQSIRPSAPSRYESETSSDMGEIWTFPTLLTIRNQFEEDMDVIQFFDEHHDADLSWNGTH